jgi:hypothetical protein
MSDLLGMQRAVWRSKRSTTEKIVLLAIIDHYSDSSPEPWPSVARLAEHCGLGRTAVLEALAALENAEVLIVRRAAGCPNHYDLSHLTHALAREPVREADQSTAEPVRQTDQSASQTSPPGERNQSARRTPPVRQADPKEPKKEPNMEPTAVRARVTGPDPATSLVERAQLVLQNPRAAAQLRPQDWPETKQIAAAYGAAAGSPRTLSELKRDSGLRAIVELIAAGYAVDDITWLASSVPREAWWRSGDRIRGLGSLSAEVASRALGERAAPPRPNIAKTRSGRSLNDEERRVHRNTLLENAAAGRYGTTFQRAAQAGGQLRDLADELERLEQLEQLPSWRLHPRALQR